MGVHLGARGVIAYMHEASRPDGRGREFRKGAFEESPGSTRIRRRVTPAESDLRDSATENSLPGAPWSLNASSGTMGAGDGETVG